MNSTARGERVLVLFAGVGLEALLIAGKTEVASVTCVEVNAAACDCIRRGIKLMRRNPSTNENAADKLRVLEGDAMSVLTELAAGGEVFDRVIAPRPKNVGDEVDGDLHSNDIGGKEFLNQIVPILRRNGRAEVHWYDFAADWELPSLERSKKGISDELLSVGGVKGVEFIWGGKASSMSVAKRQFRVCLDFRVVFEE